MGSEMVALWSLLQATGIVIGCLLVLFITAGFVYISLHEPLFVAIVLFAIFITWLGVYHSNYQDHKKGIKI